MTPRRTLLLTRPQDQSAAFAAALEAALPGRFDPVIAPMLRIEPVLDRIGAAPDGQHGPGSGNAGPAGLDGELAGAQGLVFTSANGVAVFAALSGARELPAFCVGDMTARAARAAGFKARSANGDVEGLAALVVQEARTGSGAFLHVRGRQAAGDLTGRLNAAGVPARALEIYDQRPAPLSECARALLAAGRMAVITAFSPRSAARFAEAARAEGWDLGPATLVSLSRAADAAHQEPEPGARFVADRPTRAGMIAALQRL